MELIKDFKKYMRENSGENILLQGGYCMQIYINGRRMNISKEVDGKTIMLCAIDARKDNGSIFITFQKEGTPYEIGYNGEYILLNKPLAALCDCQHPDGKVVYELLSNIKS